MKELWFFALMPRRILAQKALKVLCEPSHYREGLHPPCRILIGNIIALDIEKSMEFLFATNLNINDSDGVYKVYFDQEKYMF